MDPLDRMEDFIKELNGKCQNGWHWSIEDFEVVYGSLQPKRKQVCGNSRLCENCRSLLIDYDATSDYIPTILRLRKLEEDVAELKAYIYE